MSIIARNVAQSTSRMICTGTEPTIATSAGFKCSSSKAMTAIAEALMTSLRKIDAMHKRFGFADPAAFCKDCCNFYSGRYHDKIYRKCGCYGMTHSAATDWTGKWTACGLYNKPWPEKNGMVMEQIGVERLRDPGPLAGQMSFLHGLEDEHQ